MSLSRVYEALMSWAWPFFSTMPLTTGWGVLAPPPQPQPPLPQAPAVEGALVWAALWLVAPRTLVEFASLPSTTVKEPVYIPMEQEKGIEPVLSGVNSIIFSPS